MRKKISILLLGLSVSFVIITAPGQEQDQEEPPPASDSEEEPTPPASDDIFIPSEEVRADEELVFPVNI
jgi:hypothetical protein